MTVPKHNETTHCGNVVITQNDESFIDACELSKGKLVFTCDALIARIDN